MRARERRSRLSPSDEAIVRRFVVDVSQTIVDREMLHGGETCVLAVSGGPDSMALLHVIHRLRARFMLTLHVAHFDHAARTDSGDDAVYVREAAAELDIPVTIGRLEKDRPKDTSPEEHFRIERERFLHTVATEQGAARILTGHTLDDQAETVLLNLVSGAGRRGLGGMPPARWRVARPLIDRTRADNEAFCAALGIEPRIDPTNSDTTLRRNLFRLEILPTLASVNPRIREQLAQLSDVSRAEDYLLDGFASKAVRIEELPQGTALRAADLREQPLAIQRRAVRLLARNEHLGLTFAQCEALIGLAATGEGGSSIDLDGPLSGWLEGGLLIVGRRSKTREQDQG